MDGLMCMAQVVYYEARGEGRAGQEAVAHVVLNRGGKICKTVFKGCEFSWTCKTVQAPYGQAWLDARDVARSVLQGETEDPTDGATHFYSGKYKPGWALKFRFTVKIGAHKFYAQQ